MIYQIHYAKYRRAPGSSAPARFCSGVRTRKRRPRPASNRGSWRRTQSRRPSCPIAIPLAGSGGNHARRRRQTHSQDRGDHRRPHAEDRRRRRGQSPSAGNRRLPARHRRPQAERHRYDLRPARHPDHRPHAQAAGGGHPRDLLPARAERRVRRVHRRLHDAEAGHLPHGVRPRLPQRADGARQRHHQLLPDDPHQRLERARDRRPAAGRLRGDGPARHCQTARQGRVPGPARRGHRRGRRAGDPCCSLGPSGRRLPRPAGQAVPADDRRAKRGRIR